MVCRSVWLWWWSWDDDDDSFSLGCAHTLNRAGLQAYTAACRRPWRRRQVCPRCRSASCSSCVVLFGATVHLRWLFTVTRLFLHLLTRPTHSLSHWRPALCSYSPPVLSVSVAPSCVCVAAPGPWSSSARPWTSTTLRRHSRRCGSASSASA